MDQPLYRKIIIGVIIVFLLIVGFLVYLKIRSNGGGSAATSTATSTGNPFGNATGGGSAAAPPPAAQTGPTFQSSNSGGSSPFGSGADESGSGGAGGSGSNSSGEDTSAVTAPPGSAPSSFASGNSVPTSADNSANNPGSYLYSGGSQSSGNATNPTGNTTPVTHSPYYYQNIPVNGYPYTYASSTYATTTGTTATSTGPGAGTSTPPGFYVGASNCGINCIQGYKVPLGTVAEKQNVTLDQKQTVKTNPYVFTNITPGLHAVAVTVPTGWYVGYTLCINNTSCHNDVPVAASNGNGVVLNFLAADGSVVPQSGTIVNVPANSYVDLYWHYTQNVNDLATAPTTTDSYGNTITDPEDLDPGESLNFTGGSKNNFDDNALSDAAKSAAACIIANDIKGTVTSIISSALSAVLPDKVPTNTVTDFSKTGTFVYGIQVLPSWDSVAYCITNAIIVYITQATINWANTAFNGNPAFVQNLALLGTDIANQEALQFFKGLSTQVNSPYAAPFLGAVQQSLINQYNSFGGTGAYGPSSYTLGQYSSNPSSFMAGNWNSGGLNTWLPMTQNPANNYYGASQLARDQLFSNISSQQSNINRQLQYGNGFLPIQTCTDTSNPATCRTTTPGTVISSYLSTNLHLAQDRVVNSHTFDEAIDVLVNTLIQVSLNKILGTSPGVISGANAGLNYNSPSGGTGTGGGNGRTPGGGCVAISCQ